MILSDTPHVIRIQSIHETNDREHLRVRDCGDQVEICNSPTVAALGRAEARALRDWLSAYIDRRLALARHEGD